jgi:hypothetical protein
MYDFERAGELTRQRQPADTVQNATRSILRRGKNFQNLDLAVLEDHAVRESPASINTEAHGKYTSQ